METIPYLDLKAINSPFTTAITTRIERIFSRGWYIRGVENEEFESQFAKLCGVKYALGVANGLDALRIILKTYEFGPGDEIIVPANTFIATILAVTDCGCTPVFIEPDITTYNIDEGRIEEKITRKTKAIIVVHLYGCTAEMDKINQLARKYHLKVIEDAAQAHGAAYNGSYAGNLGDAAAFSFYPGKNLGCCGDGGCITTNDIDFITKARAISNYGSIKKYECKHRGINSRLDEIQAAILNVKIPYLHREIQKRREISKQYREMIRNDKIILPVISDERRHVWHIFAIRTQKRQQLQAFLENCGIETIVHYPIPPHKQLAYKEMNNLYFPITEKIHSEILSIPCSSALSQEHIRRIVKALNDF